MRRIDVATLRAAFWTVRAARRARRQLRAGLTEVDLPRAPRLPSSAERGVTHMLWRRAEPCLVSATVRQAWYAAQGLPRDLVIGVTSPRAGFRAHAWLDGDPPCHEERYHELVRRPVPQ
jgi:hypothetical protein